ncbi:MAG TPA: histone deacetylase [Candidatus Obscuribacterales bacterium]
MVNTLVFSRSYNTRLSEFGVDKPFALDRGELVLKKLTEELGKSVPFDEPKPLSREDMLLVHTPEYLESLKQIETWLEIFEFKAHEYFPERAVRPLTDLLSDISLKSGGTLLAAERCLETGLAANLGGGYHHAFANRGRGYCVIHDIAIAIRSLKKRALIKRAMVVDLDFHQGDGTALIFQDDADVFTLSVHSEEGWPDEKQKSDLDVGILESDSPFYLEKTEAAVRQALSCFAPDMVVFVAGSDPYEKDVLPGSRFIKLSLDTMKKRDQFVIDTFADRGIPLSMVFAGGYGPDVWEVHYFATRRLLERRGVTFAETVASH